MTTSAKKNGEALIVFRLIDPAILFDEDSSFTPLTLGSSLTDIAVAIYIVVAEALPREIRNASSKLLRPKVKIKGKLLCT